jgi:pimeloyl-ACP methyl ester carboxylesterase
VKLVWLHGWPLDERQWERQLARFGGVAPNLYRRGPSVDAWARQLLDEIDGGQLVLVGCSTGGYTALAMAKHASERIAAVVLAPSKAAPDTPERKEFRDGLIERMRKDGPPEHAFEGIPVEDLITVQLAIRDRLDATEVVREFPGVFVACAGTKDTIVSVAEATELAELAPNGRVEVFEGSDHFINLDDPDGFDAMIESLL